MFRLKMLTDRLLMRKRSVARLRIGQLDAMNRHSQYTIKFYQIALNLTLQKMNIPSKKNNNHNMKSPSNHNKPLKRSKSTELLVPKKTLKKPHDQNNNDDIFYMHTLTKSKSLKSIKPKPKSSAKVEQTKKKIKGKKNSDTKTLKKHRNIQSQQGTSILTVTSDLQAKNNCKEFFFYCNNYIPIENSAQRRLVYKLQMIDLQNKSTTDSFHRNKFENRQTNTQLIQTKDVAAGSTLTFQSCEVQTQKQKFQQSIQKCFVDVLTDLEFLYLPNQDNFQTFSHNERLHYGELLETLARKMLGGTKSIVTNNCLSDDQITVLLYQRQGIQVGALQYVPMDGFPTHLLSILAYLKNLFCFIEYAYKEEVLANLRTFYGLNYNQKVNRLTKRLPHTKDARPVLSQQMFQAFEQQMFKDYQFSSEIAKESVHWHNKALFDSVSDELQVFRPFYSSQGEPFPWTNNLGMTHYDITEEALFIIFVQAKQKVQRQVVTLCGLHLDIEGEPLPKTNQSPFYLKKVQEKIEKMVIEEGRQIDDKVDVDYVISQLKFQVAHDIYLYLLQQFQSEFFSMSTETALDEQVFDFQYFN